MYVRTLVGRSAGDIIDLPVHAATSGMSMGTCAAVTDEEMAAVGITPVRGAAESVAEEFPDGYTATPHEAGGYALTGPDGEPVSVAPIPNLAAARSAANAHVLDAAKAEAEAAKAEADAAKAEAEAAKKSARHGDDDPPPEHGSKSTTRRFGTRL